MIEFKNVCGGYGKRKIITDINIKFKKNEITTIVGENGSGKSTLLQHCARLLKPFGGEIIADGKNINDYGRRELAKLISYLPQVKSMGSITVRSLVSHGRFPYLSYPRKYSEEDKEKINQALQLTGVSDISDSLMTELSGGQQQKVYIAMVLAQDTEIILLDEPITYLDINYQFEFMELILKLREYGKTVIMVLHDLNMALNYSDTIALMQNGKILCCDNANSIAKDGSLETVFGLKAFYSKEAGQYFFMRK